MSVFETLQNFQFFFNNFNQNIQTFDKKMKQQKEYIDTILMLLEEK